MNREFAYLLGGVSMGASMLYIWNQYAGPELRRRRPRRAVVHHLGSQPVIEDVSAGYEAFVDDDEVEPQPAYALARR